MQNCRASFGHLWQQHDLSDVHLVLKTQDAVLQQIPAHVVLLSISPYFKAQVCTIVSAGSPQACCGGQHVMAWMFLVRPSLNPSSVLCLLLTAGAALVHKQRQREANSCPDLV
jgi:hypothetical protein